MKQVMKGTPVFYVARNLIDQGRVTDSNIERILNIAYAQGRCSAMEEVKTIVFTAQNADWVNLLPDHLDACEGFD